MIQSGYVWLTSQSELLSYPKDSFERKIYFKSLNVCNPQYRNMFFVGKNPLPTTFSLNTIAVLQRLHNFGRFSTYLIGDIFHIQHIRIH